MREALESFYSMAIMRRLFKMWQTLRLLSTCSVQSHAQSFPFIREIKRMKARVVAAKGTHSKKRQKLADSRTYRALLIGVWVYGALFTLCGITVI